MPPDAPPSRGIGAGPGRPATTASIDSSACAPGSRSHALAAIDADDPEITAIATAALASMPTDYDSPTLTKMRDALVELRG